MIKVALIVVLYSVAIPFAAISQIKYLEEGNKGLGIDLNYSYLNNTDNFQGQVGYSGSGVFDIGVIYAKASVANLIGAYCERSVLKPNQDLPFGINLGLSVSRSWASDYFYYAYGPYRDPMRYEVNVRTQSASIDIEAYLLIKANEGVSFYPSIQIAREFISTNPSGFSDDSPYMGYIYDIDIYIKASNKIAIIFTPGYLQIKGENSIAFSLAFMKYI